MVKKLFALASVTALAGLVSAVAVAGCSSDSNDAGPGSPDASTDAPKEAKPPVEAGPDEDTSCYKDDPVDTSDVAYKPARIQAGKCSADVIKKIDDLIKANQNASFDDLKAELVSKESQGCADCVFGLESGDKWAPILTNDDGSKVVDINGGGCVEALSGKTECGKAFQEWSACLDTACADCADADQSQCAKDVQQSACSKQTDELGAKCGNNVNAFLQGCFKSGEPSIYGPIRALCVGSGAKDGGND